jgi:hypothetical protein
MLILLDEKTRNLTVKNDQDAMVLNGYKRGSQTAVAYCDHCNKVEVTIYTGPETEMIVVTVDLKFKKMIQTIESVDEFDDVPTGKKTHSSGNIGMFPVNTTSHETERRKVSERITSEVTFWYVGSCDRCDHEVKIQVPLVKVMVHRNYDVGEAE